MKMLEHNQQVALFCWATLQLSVYPELRWMHAVPNSAQRTPRQGAWMKAEGLKSGVWDIHLPIPRNWKSGLWIEMKCGKNKLTPAQEQFRLDLAVFFDFAVCYSWTDAKDAIVRYLDEAKF